jgi:hypothetical protein
MERQLEVGDIFRSFGPAYREIHGKEMPLRHLRAMRAIETCRTSALGGHVDECDECGSLRISYNSCRNRHCPKCQCLDKERWLTKRKKDILPTHYFHNVFTIPEGLRPLALRNQKVLYDILFKAVSNTLKDLSENPKHLGGRIGFIAVLHTWTQTLIDHPHIHCIVPGGVLSFDEHSWKESKEEYFIPVKVLSRLFRGKFLDYLKKSYVAGELVFPGKISYLDNAKAFNRFLTGLYNQEWVVYCKPPIKNPDDVIDYLGRYTHRVAITNDRIIKLEDGKVTFRYRDRNDGNKIRYMSLDAFEFIRRFLLHVLPDKFMKIRYYGILSNRNRNDKLSLCRELLGVKLEGDNEEGKESWEDILYRVTGVDPMICPHCGKGRMVLRENLIPRRGRCPPL